MHLLLFSDLLGDVTCLPRYSLPSDNFWLNSMTGIMYDLVSFALVMAQWCSLVVSAEPWFLWTIQIFLGLEFIYIYHWFVLSAILPSNQSHFYSTSLMIFYKLSSQTLNYSQVLLIPCWRQRKAECQAVSFTQVNYGLAKLSWA